MSPRARLGLLLVGLLGAGPHGERVRVQAQGLSTAAASGASTLELQIAAQKVALAEHVARRSALTADLAVGPTRTAQLERALAREVRALYRMQQSGLLPLSGGLDALLGHASRMGHLERMATRTLTELEATRRGTARLGDEVTAVEREIARLEQALAELESTRAQLVREAAEAQAAREPAVSLAPRPSTDRMGYGLSLVGGERATSFEQQRGELALPIAAATQIDGAADGKGLTFATRAGASVRAVADGEVAEVAQEPDGSARIVVAHDARHRTIYRGLASTDVQPGDAVSKSARLGTAGATPLTFEVQRDAHGQDARRWLGL